MNAVEIEEAISDLVIQEFDRAEFPYLFLESFGNKETTLKRLRKGNSNRTDVEGAVLQRSNIHILAAEVGGVEAGLKALRDSPKTEQQKAKFILATDGIELQAEDMKSGEVLACDYADLPNHFGFLLPLAGITTVSEIKNNAIDIKATGRLDKLYVALLQKNPDWGQQENREAFNHFMAQLIFCFFAEDTRIFNGENLFTATVQQMSESDGSNTQEIISNIFAAMDIDPRKNKRKGVRPYADVFPYVNGGLFGAKDGESFQEAGSTEGATGKCNVPKFSKMARTYLLRAGDLDWTAINPDIFGSMIQAVADDAERGELGMHYTSVPNILKVLNPLFLDSLREDLGKAGDSKIKLLNLRKRISCIRVFDPACGSGNFLVIAYKHMRAIENELNDRRGEKGRKSEIPLTNFRGIEIKSFAAEIARLALIIAEYQCDELYIGQREALALFLPLNEQNWITCGNALRLDWLSICPPTGETSVKLHGDDLFNTPRDQCEIDFENEGGETYICGNPPYAGHQQRTSKQIKDMKDLFSLAGIPEGDLDFVLSWVELWKRYSKMTGSASAFVMTNSVCQGRQVPRFWKSLIKDGCRISFAHTSFPWTNNASKNAAVVCVIVGLDRKIGTPAYLYQEDTVQETDSITAYLTKGQPVFVEPRNNGPISEQLTPMRTGNMPIDGGHLVLSLTETVFIRNSHPDASKFIRPFLGSKELNQGLQRFCLWIQDRDLQLAESIPAIKSRLEACQRFRNESSRIATNKLSPFPHRFAETQDSKNHIIALQNVSSENKRIRTPVIWPSEYMISNLCFGLYDGNVWELAIISSKIHHCWIEALCGKLKTDFRYSNTLGWNTFPVPKLTTRNKEELTRTAENILLAREAHFPATIADLYKPDAMPENLRAAHNENDRILEEIYIGRKFKNDTERLEKLFEMYTEMTTKVTK